MSHLTEEQFEQFLQGTEMPTGHLADCDMCKQKLAEKKALKERLRSAFSNIEPSADLAHKIRQEIRLKQAPGKTLVLSLTKELRSHWRAVTAATTAIAAMLILAPIFIYTTTEQATAAQAALVEIHEHNLSADHGFHSEADPEKLAAYFKDKLGFSVIMPESGHGLALRGCCVRHFQGQVVGSYVVETPAGVISVVVVTDTPQSMGISGKFKKGSHTYWKSQFAKCDMVSVRIGGYSYCAVGEISHEYLTDLLSRLLPQEE
jgi:anti-sigma factor RsiW